MTKAHATDARVGLRLLVEQRPEAPVAPVTRTSGGCVIARGREREEQ